MRTLGASRFVIASDAPGIDRLAEDPAGRPRPACASCHWRELCLPSGLDADELRRVEQVVYARRRLRPGDVLFHADGEFASLYAIRSGFVKTRATDAHGREQVTGFFMAGELLGLDGIASGRYGDSAIALEDTEVCILHYALIEELSREIRGLQRQLHAAMSREIVRDHGVMLLLGTMSAEERLAVFLLNLARRYARRGYSASEFLLRMSREDIGSYIGLKLETVSRLFSQFRDAGLLEVHGRHVRIVDIAGLEALRSRMRVRS